MSEIIFLCLSAGVLRCPSNEKVALEFKNKFKLPSSPTVTSYQEFDSLGILGSDIIRACAECRYQITLPEGFVKLLFLFIERVPYLPYFLLLFQKNDKLC